MYLYNMKIEIGQLVKSKKNGNGTITAIITKSTGYVEVSFENGSIKKEMAFNLQVNGVDLKEKKQSGSKLNPANFMSAERFAQSKYATMSKDDFLEERQRDAMNSKSW